MISMSGFRPRSAHEACAFSRRHLLAGLGGTAAVAALSARVWAQTGGAPVDLSPVAAPSASVILWDTSIAAINQLSDPPSSRDREAGVLGHWPERGTQWVEYRWQRPISTDRIDVYWWDDQRGTALPAAARLYAWNNGRFIPVAGAQWIGTLADRYNSVRFPPVTTDRLRIETDSRADKSAGVIRWRVFSAGTPPPLAPVIDAGDDRTLVVGGRSYLDPDVRWALRRPGDTLAWSQSSGPATIAFAERSDAAAVAIADIPGEYVLAFTARTAGGTVRDTLKLRVAAPPPPGRLLAPEPAPWSVSGAFWPARFKALVTRWIPHCITYCERTDLKQGDGGVANLIAAGRALRGEPHPPHRGKVYANAWVLQTFEAMAMAQLLDPAGDAEMLASQAAMRETMARWLPLILAAQEPDGYFQTAFTLADRKEWPARWNPPQRDNHEGYIAGYFIDAAIAHHAASGGRDRRFYDAARRLADCWAANIGPGRKTWYDGHQAIEQSLFDLADLVDRIDGGPQGARYRALSRFLIDARRGGLEYDQSHVTPSRQYAAVGHAVRASYLYSAMADVAATTGDIDYNSAVASISDDIVDRKYYLTGGIGGFRVNEGFGEPYELPNDGYCESCSSCGLISFQHKLARAYRRSDYADRFEETLYNALLGAMALDGKSYSYTNPLIDTERGLWDRVPCCIGNIARTLLMLPRWSYAHDADNLYVNLFVGGRSTVDMGRGRTVELIQETDYPWRGGVAIMVNPAATARFAIRLRIPDRATSPLYAGTPAVRGVEDVTVNGSPVRWREEAGYAVIEREWRSGDRIGFVVPLAVQRVAADPAVTATRGMVALRYGPLVYNVETADQPRIDRAIGAAPVNARWRPELLGGVVALEGRWADGSPLVAIPNYARMNRTGMPPREFPRDQPSTGKPPRSRVWITRDASSV